MSEITLTIPTIDEKIIMVEDKKTGFWSNVNNYLLVFSDEGDKNNFQLAQKDNRLFEIDDQYLLELFIQKHIELRKHQIDQEATGIEEDDDGTSELDVIPKPDFDPEQIRVDARVFSLSDVVRFINNSRIDLSPDFQRHFVWKEKEKKSRLIESLLLRIPLPMFYLAENDEGLYQVVDGVQRLSTIRDFMSNQLPLKGLEYLGDCEGKTFEMLALKYQRRLEDTQFTFNVIAPTTPSSVKTEIFKRLNLGGKPLNRQEIRNSLAKPDVRNLIKKMAESDAFKTATNNSVKPLRMDDQELVMRFVAFYLQKTEKIVAYKGDMEGYLDEALDYLNGKEARIIFNILETNFYNSMQNAFHLFGKYAFRKATKSAISKNQKPPINKSLFTAWSVMLSEYDNQEIKNYCQEDVLVNVLANYLETDRDYLDSLTTGTSQVSKLEYSFEIASKITHNYLKLSEENA